MTKRMEPQARRAQILDTAMRLSEESHYLKVTQADIADELSISGSLVLAYFDTMDNLRHNIITRANETGNPKIIAQVASVGKKILQRGSK